MLLLFFYTFLHIILRQTFSSSFFFVLKINVQQSQTSIHCTLSENKLYKTAKKEKLIHDSILLDLHAVGHDILHNLGFFAIKERATPSTRTIINCVDNVHEYHQCVSTMPIPLWTGILCWLKASVC